jgi:enterochelin esterase-like enzyme
VNRADIALYASIAKDEEDPSEGCKFIAGIYVSKARVELSVCPVEVYFHRMRTAGRPRQGVHDVEYGHCDECTKGKCYPVIYVLDGNGAFPLVVGIQRSLASTAEAPAAYVVGVGYPTEAGYLHAVGKRNRDYAPNVGGAYERTAMGRPVTAGAPAFSRFLTEELKPLLKSRYAVDESDETLIGVSLGGLFAAWSLLTTPSSFGRYILVSPAIFWNSGEVWSWEQALADEQKDLSASVFVSEVHWRLARSFVVTPSK